MKKEKQRNATMLGAMTVVSIGLGVFVRGMALAWRPGGWMVAGIFIAVPALFVAYDAFREK